MKPPLLVRIVLLGLVVVVGCASEPVGRLCDLGSQPPNPHDIVIASPSLDCISRTCLRVPPPDELPPGSVFPAGNTGLCTAECTADEDCERAEGSPCTTGFACRIAVPVGPYCCRRMCMCRDYGLPIEPAACDPANPDNTCPNLPGRS